jgi:acid phosphatase type 7
VIPLGPRRSLVTAGIAFLGLALAGCTPARDVLPVYLTWSDEDTSTTMTVNYHTRGPFAGSHVYYDTQPRNGELARYASHTRGFERRIRGVDRSVHVVPLTRLQPGTTYWFIAGDPTSGFSEERSFRTLPDDDSPVSFVVGGDMATGWWPRLTSWQAARTDPSFALLGGDLAYCRGGPEGEARWQQWFADWEASMRAPDGRLIPLVAAIGNHDRRDGGGSDPAEVAPFFTGFLYQDPGGRSYFARRFGPRVALFVLDSGHLEPHGGAQTAWLEAQLRASADLPVRFALYHVALFPAHQAIGKAVEAGRMHWLPLFDAFRLTAAFEHHGHLHKRTLPLRAGSPVADGTGTVFFGDGDWGKSRARESKPERTYLAASFPRRHFWQVTVSQQGVRYQAIDGFGRVFDRAAEDASGAWIRE